MDKFIRIFEFMQQLFCDDHTARQASEIELRQQPFLWADDLSAYDSILDLGFNIPFYGDHVSLFTLLMTISTVIYTRLNEKMMGSTNTMPASRAMLWNPCRRSGSTHRPIGCMSIAGRCRPAPGARRSPSPEKTSCSRRTTARCIARRCRRRSGRLPGRRRRRHR